VGALWNGEKATWLNGSPSLSKSPSIGQGLAAGKAVAVVILLLLVGGGLYLYEGGKVPNLKTPSIPGLGSGPQGGSSSSLEVTSATLETGDILSLDLLNNAGSSTKTIQLMNVCSPDYSDCRSLSTGLQPNTFDLPSGATYIENLTIPQFFCSSESECWGTPIPGQSYFFQVQATMASGGNVNLNVPAIATGSFPMNSQYPGNAEYQSIALQEVESASVVIYSNLTGTMSMTLLFNELPAFGVTATLYNHTTYTYDVPTQSSLVTVSNRQSNCAAGCPNIIGGSPEVQLSTSFSTVTTGVASGAYYLVGVDVNYYGTYYFWLKSGTTGAQGVATSQVLSASGPFKGYVQSTDFKASNFNASATASTFTCAPILGSEAEPGVDVNVINQGDIPVAVQNVTVSTAGGTVTLTPSGSCTAASVSAMELKFTGFPHFATYPTSGESFTLTVDFADGQQGTLQYKFG